MNKYVASRYFLSRFSLHVSFIMRKFAVKFAILNFPHRGIFISAFSPRREGASVGKTWCSDGRLKAHLSFSFTCSNIWLNFLVFMDVL